MNDFTLEELESLLNVMDVYTDAPRYANPYIDLILKIEGMIVRYCEHEQFCGNNPKFKHQQPPDHPKICVKCNRFYI